MDESAKEEIVAGLADEYLDAYRRGEAPSVTEFAAQHPECREDLLDLLPMMLEVEGVSRTATRTARDVAASYPERLGGYRLLNRLGHGGMGTVFRAEHEALKREVAIKILFPSWSSDARHCEAFEKESRVIAALHHTNIVEVFGAGHEGEYRYYVMSLVKGRGVTPASIREAFPGTDYSRAVARVGLQASKALAYAHSQGILHRDVKPGNLLLGKDGILYVGDFGLATVLNMGEDAPLVTQSHDGTLRYMAPERLMRGENSYAGDQYSLGLTLYEMVTGRPAFREVEPGKLIHRICSAPLELLQNEGELGAIINKSISFHPEDRYASMSDMVEDLQRYLNGEPVKARPINLLRRYAMWVKRRPAVALWSHVAAGLVVMLFASISWGYANENEQRQLAETNARIADTALKRIFDSMMTGGEGEQILQNVTKADAMLLLDLMPYYEQIASQGGPAEDDMAIACYTLAAIAHRTGDDDTARLYYRRALEKSQPLSVEYARAANGLALSLLKDRRTYRKEVQSLLTGVLSAESSKLGDAYRLEQVKALFTLLEPRYGLLRSADTTREQMRELRMQYFNQAVCLVAALVEANPDNEQARLFQLRLLERMPRDSWKKTLAPNGESPLSLLETLLKNKPDSRIYRRAYVEHILRPQPRRREESSVSSVNLKRAVDYAQTLLAEFPADNDLLLSYLVLRNRYAILLKREGKDAEAERFNANTLGALALLTSRPDFTPQMRERLAILVAHYPAGEEARAQQQSEISLLLQSYDEKRMQELRSRMRKMGRRPLHGPYRPFRPAPPSGGGRPPHH